MCLRSNDRDFERMQLTSRSGSSQLSWQWLERLHQFDAIEHTQVHTPPICQEDNTVDSDDAHSAWQGDRGLPSRERCRLLCLEC